LRKVTISIFFSKKTTKKLEISYLSLFLKQIKKMDNLLEKLAVAVDYIRSKTDFEPQYGIILGTGLGGLVADIDIKHSIEYSDIPHFPVSTVESHKGRLLFGYIGEKAIVAMQGRFHYYEGYSMKQVTFPVRVLKKLGITKLFISNVSGSVNQHINTGDLLIIQDHIDLQKENPLRGHNYDELGPRFPDMSEPYSQKLIDKAVAIAKKHNFRHHVGVYVSVSGPNLETKAEYVFLNRIGADAVGMSTVPEVIVAVHSGVEVFAISVITDANYPPERVTKVTLEEVIAVAIETEPKMTQVMRELIMTAE